MAVTEGQGGYAGQQGITSGTSQYNALRFVIFQALGEVSTIKIVQVKAVDAAAETVDVQPMVNLMDGAKQTIPQGTIFGIPFAKIRAGVNQITMTPAVGDIGVMACADRDISTVKTNKGQGNPGSFRRHHPSDGIYLMGLFGEDPEQFIRFSAGGISIEDKNGNLIDMKSGSVEVTTSLLKVNGPIQATGEITAHSAVPGVAVSLGTHLHTSGAAGFPTSVPTPGT